MFYFLRFFAFFWRECYSESMKQKYCFSWMTSLLSPIIKIVALFAFNIIYYSLYATDPVVNCDDLINTVFSTGQDIDASYYYDLSVCEAALKKAGVWTPTQRSIKDIQNNHLSSWIRWAFYNIEWCSPRRTELGWWNETCKEWYFQINSSNSNVHISWDGQDFTADRNSLLYRSFDQISTQLKKNLSQLKDPANIKYFEKIFKDGLGISLEWEWVIRMLIYVIDYADNVSQHELIYKIDKTAPKLTWKDITENSDFIYYDKNVGWFTPNEVKAFRNDSFKKWLTDTYKLWDGWISVDMRQRGNFLDKRSTLYYSHTGEVFTAGINVDDTWNGYLTSRYNWSFTLAPARIDRVGPLIAGISKKMQFLSGTTMDSIIRNTTISSGIALWSASWDLSWNNFPTDSFTANPNTQPSSAWYRFRVKDDTVGKRGIGNFIEYPLYAVLDTTAPNGGSATGIIFLPSEKSVCDEWLSSTTCHFTKFLTASATQSLTIKINDDILPSGIGVSWASYSHYNAGILTGGSLIHEIEQSNNASTMKEYRDIVTNNPYVSTKTIIHDFSKVDGVNDKNTLWGYRYYSGSWISTFPDWSTENKICDRVANCTSFWDFAYRVMANRVDTDKSTLSVTPLRTSDNKVIANGVDGYSIRYALKDAYGNMIIPVDSQEKNETSNNKEWLIRRIKSWFQMRNELMTDMRKWNGDDGITWTDMEDDNLSTPTNTLKEHTIPVKEYYTYEDSQELQRDGEFSYKLQSLVPTYEMYPWLLPDQRIGLTGSGLIAESKTSITPSDISKILADPSAALWNFSIWDERWENLLWFTSITENPALQYNIELPDDYGMVPTNIWSLSKLSGKRLSFGFAAPVLWYWKWLDGFRDGAWKKYTQDIYMTDDKFREHFDDYSWYEKYPVCEIVAPDTVCKDAHIGSNSNIVRYMSNVQNFDMTSGNIGYSSGWTLDTHFFDPTNITKDGWGSMWHFLEALENPVRMTFLSLTGKVYDPAKLRVWVVSGISYTNSDGTTLLEIQLPGPSRNIFSPTGWFLSSQGSANYFRNTYSIGPSADATRFATNIADVAVIGYTNTYYAITSLTNNTTTILDTDISAKSRDIFRKRAAEATRSIGDDRWCRDTNALDAYYLLDPTEETTYKNGSKNCSLTIGDELNIFVKGNTKIMCGDHETCDLHGKKINIIIKDGVAEINSNITTLDDGGNNAGRVFIGSFLSQVENTTITDTDDLRDKKWTIKILSPITNIDAYLFTEGSIITNTVEGRTWAIIDENLIKNQLYIYGWVFSQNTIGWSRKGTPECPYIINTESCDQIVAQIYDLTFLRRYHLINKTLHTGNSADSGSLITYNDGLRAWGGIDKCSWSYSWNLRCMEDDRYQWSPLIIEWNKSLTFDPSLFMISDQ